MEAVEQNRLYPLDKRETVMEIERRVWAESPPDDADGDAIVIRVSRVASRSTLWHRIRHAGADALIERERGAQHDPVAANAGLWDVSASHVKGYDWEDVSPGQWADVTPEIAARIPAEDKSQVVVGLYAAQFEIERPKGRGFVLGAEIHKVRQTYGPYALWHVFKKSGEQARRDFARESGDLQAYADFYDEYFDRLEGVTGDDPDIVRRKDLVNALWKRGAINALMRSFLLMSVTIE
jgi:hypothetical protein